MRRELLSVVLGLGLLAACGGDSEAATEEAIRPEGASSERPAPRAEPLEKGEPGEDDEGELEIEYV